MDEPKKRPLPYDAQDGEELFNDSMSVSSMTECTGLIPAAPVSEPEIDSYSAIYARTFRFRVTRRLLSMACKMKNKKMGRAIPIPIRADNAHASFIHRIF